MHERALKERQQDQGEKTLWLPGGSVSCGNPEPTGASKSQAQLLSDGRRWRRCLGSKCRRPACLGCNRSFDFADQSQLTCGDGAQPETAILSPAWTTRGAPVPSSERSRRG